MVWYAFYEKARFKMWCGFILVLRVHSNDQPWWNVIQCELTMYVFLCCFDLINIHFCWRYCYKNARESFALKINDVMGIFIPAHTVQLGLELIFSSLSSFLRFSKFWFLNWKSLFVMAASYILKFCLFRIFSRFFDKNKDKLLFESSFEIFSIFGKLSPLSVIWYVKRSLRIIWTKNVSCKGFFCFLLLQVCTSVNNVWSLEK